MNIPEAAVEAAAKALFIDQGGDALRWDEERSELLHDYFLRRSRRILEAAAPHMLAQFVMEAEQQRMIADYERTAK